MAAPSGSDEETGPGFSNDPKTPDFKEELDQDLGVLDNPDLDLEEIDFASPKFNPALALKAEIVSVPSPDILTFESLSGYEEAATRRRQKRESKSQHQTVIKSNKPRTSGFKRRPSTGDDKGTSSGKTTEKSRPSISTAASKLGEHVTQDSTKSYQYKPKTERSNERGKERSNSQGDKPKTGTSSKYCGRVKTVHPLGAGQTSHSQNSEHGTEIKSVPEDKSSLGSSRKHGPRITKTQHHGRESARSRENYERSRESHQPIVETTGSSSSERRKKIHTSEEEQQMAGVSQHRDRKPSTSVKPSGKKQLKNVFTRMEDMTGPLSFLTRCVKDKEHVRVVTRGAVTLSSICRGYIVAFDKYFNMAMIDVDEIYRRPAELGKVRARVSHKLRAAQETLNKERDEYEMRRKFKSGEGKGGKENKPASPSSTISSTESKSTPSALKNIQGNSTQTDSRVAENVNQNASHESLEQSSPNANSGHLQSVYSNHTEPLSRYERESLMLGIPDENIEHRHLNQLLLRGENVVSISIIEEL